jgi:hypothetical protein
MKKLRTAYHFTQYMDDEFAWRLKEIADIKLAIRGTEESSRRALLRAGVPILYAHWEGFIKASSEALLHFVNNQNLRLRDLKPCFIVFGAKKHINDLVESGSPRDRIGAVEFFLNQLDAPASLAVSGSIWTEFNLSSKVFERIASSLGVDTGRYATKYVLIDSSLLARRNNIAHGAFFDLGEDDFFKLSDEVIGLLRSYKNDLENLVTTGLYKSL